MANLETITGSLENALARADRRTIQHAWEITNDRRTQPDLREQWFWTADFPLYRVEDGEAVLYFAPGEYNLVFDNIGDAAPQIKATGNYTPSKKDEARVVRSAKSGKTLRVPLSGLELREERAALAEAFAVVMRRVAEWTPEMYAAFSRAITDRLKGLDG